MSDALSKLIEAVEAGTMQSLDLICLDAISHGNAQKAYNGSLDAAKALHEALLPGWSILIHGGHHGAQDFAAQIERVLRGNRRLRGNGRASTPARAWLLAILRAYATQQEPAA